MNLKKYAFHYGHNSTGSNSFTLFPQTKPLSFMSPLLWILTWNTVYFYKILKGKAVLLQAWSGPEGSKKLRFPDYMTTAQDGGKVVSLMHQPPLPLGNAPGAHFCQTLSRLQGHSAIRRIMSMKNCNDIIWDRTSDLPICSTASTRYSTPKICLTSLF